MNIKLSEIFYSFQGESSLAGKPTVFVRFAGCNLRCKICDTTYSFKPGFELSVAKIVSTVTKVNCKYVCITGGEPLMQREALLFLLPKLHARKKLISMETNGACSLDGIPAYVKKVVDVKTPSTGNAGSFDKSILKLLSVHDELKFVISNKADYEFGKIFITENKISRIGCNIIFSPNLAVKRFANKLVEWILADELNVVFGPQLHKLIKERTIKLI